MDYSISTVDTMKRLPSSFILVLSLHIGPTLCLINHNGHNGANSNQRRRTDKHIPVAASRDMNRDDHKTEFVKPSSEPVPNHVAFVCDGNSRWARQRGLPVIAGHSAGADRLVDMVLPCLREKGVKYCTMYGFSTENWKRSEKEIADIFTVMERSAETVYDRLLKRGDNIRVQILGDLSDSRIPPSLVKALDKLEHETDRLCDDESSQSHTLCLAINYGGRKDILEAAKKLARAAAVEGSADSINELSEDDFSQLLCTNGVPDPDLVIRTSGECRLSNFLLWNTAYSELYFTPTLWPDFDRAALQEALDWYASRKRRFGARNEIVGTVNGHYRS